MEDVISAAKDLLRYIFFVSQEKLSGIRNSTTTSDAKDLVHYIWAVSYEKALTFKDFTTPLLIRSYEITSLRAKELAESSAVKSMVEKSGGILSVKGIATIGFGWLCWKVVKWLFSGGGGGKMMNAPGKPGVRIPRQQFVGNPKSYFRDLRAR